MNLTPDQWFYGIAVLCSIISAVLSQRAAAWSKAANMTGIFLNKIMGKPDKTLTRPTTGHTVISKVESLGEDTRAMGYNQLLIAQTLRILSDDISRIQGNGKRRLPTDAITLPEGYNGSGLRDSNSDSSAEGLE